MYQQECYRSYHSTASGRRWYTLSRALSCDTDDLRTQDPHRAPKARSPCPQTCKIAPKSLSEWCCARGMKGCEHEALEKLTQSERARHSSKHWARDADAPHPASPFPLLASARRGLTRAPLWARCKSTRGKAQISKTTSGRTRTERVAPQTGHAVCDAHVSHPSQPARHLADSAQNARTRALPWDERMPAELRGRELPRRRGSSCPSPRATLPPLLT